jgi:hypothetical protein
MDILDIMDWFATRYGDDECYTQYFGGFNIPGEAMREFTTWDDHHHHEEAMLNKLRKAGAFEEERFYVIGTYKDDDEEEYVAHELRHGIFYCNADYKREMREVVRQFKVKKLRAALKEIGYVDKVMDDEIQAYALTGWPDEAKPITQEMKKLKRELKKVERKYLS